MAKKIVAHQKIFRNDRFLLQMAIGLMPHDQILRGIELYGTKVAPLVREGIIPGFLPMTVNAVSGYSGGGKSMIAEFEAVTTQRTPST